MFPLRDRPSSGKFPLVNLGIIIFTAYIFLQEISTPNPDAFIAQWALIPSQINFFNLTSLVPFLTNVFLHAGWLHIISNLWFLWIFGDNVEAKLGSLTYLIFYLIAGIVASLVQYFVDPASPIPALGASGAIAGVLGAYMVFFPDNKIDTLVPIFLFPVIILIPAGFMLIYWFITQLFSGVATVSTTLGGIAWWAYIGGFSFGYLVGKLSKD